MTIYQRDRDFHQIFADINIDVIPLKFIQDVTCYLHDGTTVVLCGDDFTEDERTEGNLEALIRNISFYDQVNDLKIRINYGRVEEFVSIDVDKILRNMGK
jgi:hypothetical protein